MNFKSFVVVLILGACLTQQTTAQPNRKVARDIIEEVIKAATEAVNKLKIYVENIYLETSNSLNDRQTQINRVSAESLNYVVSEIAKLNVQSGQVIDNTAQKASEQRIEIAKCLNQVKEQLQNIVFLYTKKEEQECVLNYSSIINADIENIMGIILDAEQYVHMVAQEVQQCATSDDPLGCGTKVIADIAVMEKELPIKLQSNLITLNDSMRNVTVMLTNCGSVQVVNAGTDMFQVINKVALCVYGNNPNPLKLK